MNKIIFKNRNRAAGIFFGLMTALLLVGPALSEAAINGITGPTFNLTAKTDHISTADGGSYLIWGFANADVPGSRAQYPGPTLMVNQGQEVTVNLSNQLTVPVSIVFPGQQGLTATGDQEGPLTWEALGTGGTASYTFVASQPGTYTYYSGTNPDLQIEMGLVGVLIVRPYGYVPGDMMTYKAYDHMDSQYDREYLFFLSEMDPKIHNGIEFGTLAPADVTTFWPVYWFINGRTAPDTMFPADIGWLPTQPYSSMVSMHPGEKVLLRIVGAGRDSHPYHTHGNHVKVIARDGRLLSSAPGAGADLARMEFTLASAPGQTMDGIFQWTGENMGWDIYGHAPGDPMELGEDPDDHGKPFPVQLPPLQDLTFGPWYSGSPFLGAGGSLPPGEGGLNPNAGFFFMWHSHNENEIVNFNLFPGGMLTMAVVEHPSVEIME